jgi:hypothetical protein
LLLNLSDDHHLFRGLCKGLVSAGGLTM